MADFRYAQFCPLARAAELIGERWTLLVIRELLTGPQRFSDLKRRLEGISSSVLAGRLERLERIGVVVRRELPPPAASSVYALGESGRALFPVVRELVRWGLRFLEAPRPGDHFQAEWLPLALQIFARQGPSPERSFEVETRHEGEPVRVRLEGGARGTELVDPDAATAPPDLRIKAHPLAVLALLRGDLDPETALERMECEGDRAALADFARLFDLSVQIPESIR
jgi:DNA-binding HxlR family transcriptional regulator